MDHVETVIDTPPVTKHVIGPELTAPVTRRGDIEVVAPTAVPRRTQRANAGMHSNPHHIPMSTCNTIQVLMYCLSC